VKWNNNDVILDAYNANPSSMKVAIDNFANTPSFQKIVCLGGMKELGADSIQEHQDLIDYLQKFEWKQVILVGGDFKTCAHPYLFFETTDQAKNWILDQHFQQHTILIKGSRGIQMEKIIA
jgi:UDP-N-acetylmuramoyl-tripeptide--D-alanyl-D-alanine ligase